MQRAELLATLRAWRRSDRLAQAQALLAELLLQHPQDSGLALLAWQHQDFWWQPVVGNRVSLIRRGSADLDLVRRCWADAHFMDRFNRLAVRLPADDDALRALLLREHWALPGENKALHWTIHSANQAWGFVSLVEISLTHRRAEFLIGTLPGTASRLAVAAAHLLLGFAAGRVGLQRLVAHFYPENKPALQAALHLGFSHEGLLRQHVLLPNGQRCDLVVTGLALDAAYFASRSAFRQRLIGPAAAAIENAAMHG